MRALILAGLCAGLTFALPAFAGDLTGTYVGKLSCKSMDDTGARSDFSSFYFFGETYFDDRKPQYAGTGIVHECTHLATPQTDYMSMHFKYKVKPSDGKGMMKGMIIVDDDAMGSKTICKAAFKRVNPMDPNVPFCP
jgi:hypothetical protein